MKTEKELFENAIDTTSVNGKTIREYLYENYTIIDDCLEGIIQQEVDDVFEAVRKELSHECYEEAPYTYGDDYLDELHAYQNGIEFAITTIDKYCKTKAKPDNTHLLIELIRTEIAQTKDNAEIMYGHQLGFDKIYAYEKCLEIIDKYMRNKE